MVAYVQASLCPKVGDRDKFERQKNTIATCANNNLYSPSARLQQYGSTSFTLGVLVMDRGGGPNVLCKFVWGHCQTHSFGITSHHTRTPRRIAPARQKVVPKKKYPPVSELSWENEKTSHLPPLSLFEGTKEERAKLKTNFVGFIPRLRHFSACLIYFKSFVRLVEKQCCW